MSRTAWKMKFLKKALNEMWAYDLIALKESSDKREGWMGLFLCIAFQWKFLIIDLTCYYDSVGFMNVYQNRKGCSEQKVKFNFHILTYLRHLKDKMCEKERERDSISKQDR